MKHRGRRFRYRLAAILIIAFLAATLFFTLTVAKDYAFGVGRGAESPLCVMLLGRDEVGGHSDVIALLRVDPIGGEISLLQIPRDTYVRFGAYEGKLNGYCDAYGEEGLQALLSQTLGVSVDGRVSLDTEAVAAIVDALGGVTVCVPRDLFYEDPAQGLRIDLHAGEQTLFGDEVCGLLRYRKGYAMGDLERLNVQKRVLCAIAKKTSEGISLPKLLEIYEGIQGKVLTNLSKRDIISFMRLLHSVRQGARYALVTLPGGSLYLDGISYYVPCRAACFDVLQEHFGASASLLDLSPFCNESDAAKNIYEDKNLRYTVFTEEDLLP